MIVQNGDRRPRDLQPGVLHTVLAYSDDLMLCEVCFEEGISLAEHSHPHQQAMYVVEGSVELSLGSEKRVLAAGDSCSIAADLAHGVKALTKARVLDVFTPARQDFYPFAPAR
ncbi:MAG: cupin domain-containing protein [Chloroflexi bacterium]|nr:cupin domain-containing protein [Chloroflexota bacterium]